MSLSLNAAPVVNVKAIATAPAVVPSPGIFDFAIQGRRLRHRALAEPGEGEPEDMCQECKGFHDSLDNANPETQGEFAHLIDIALGDLTEGRKVGHHIATADDVGAAMLFVAQAATQIGYLAGLAQAALAAKEEPTKPTS